MGSKLAGIGDTELFTLRLAQAIHWCSRRADAAKPALSLRFDQFQPHTLEVDRAATVKAPIHQRTVYVPRDLAPVLSGEEMAGGRLLAYFPDAELSDGAAEQETDGFFDSYNAPPWDTWVGLFQDATAADLSYRVYLVAWIPPVFLHTASRGIAVNPESCIVWLADVETSVTAELRACDLLR